MAVVINEASRGKFRELMVTCIESVAGIRLLFFTRIIDSYIGIHFRGRMVFTYSPAAGLRLYKVFK